jgi:hypothetical protein
LKELGHYACLNGNCPDLPCFFRCSIFFADCLLADALLGCDLPIGAHGLHTGGETRIDGIDRFFTGSTSPVRLAAHFTAKHGAIDDFGAALRARSESC